MPQLARALQRYKNRSVQVLAIPHGGVRVGYEVASSLDSDFSILIACKLPFPENPESGFGAVAEDGSTVILNEAVPYLSKVVIQDIIDRQKKEVSRRISSLRENAPPLPLWWPFPWLHRRCRGGSREWWTRSSL